MCNTRVASLNKMVAAHEIFSGLSTSCPQTYSISFDKSEMQTSDRVTDPCQEDYEAQEIKVRTFEPTPIDHEGPLQAVPRVSSLPGKMKLFCEEYIAALSHLIPEDCETELMTKKSSSIPQVEPLPLASIFEAWDSSETTSSSAASDRSDHSQEDSLLEIQSQASTRIHPYQHERWNERYQDLVHYFQEHQHCNVPYVYKQNPCLGQWVKRQRHQYKLFKQGAHSNLNDDRIQSLNMLGFIWDSHGAAWEEKYQDLKTFHSRHGHVNVPCSYIGSSKLSTWIKRQRRQYRLFMSHQPSTMTLERISKLESLGLVWDYYGKGN